MWFTVDGPRNTDIVYFEDLVPEMDCSPALKYKKQKINPDPCPILPAQSSRGFNN
jgi:hypothetical protein